ncbi:TetR/AcrR family transcriptional regulator [Limimaricola pyoseonensis]|uniref:DNA-binding transcriptional regulator, AcrR family n=1 Tax=Limimaricola pyoseonensis TaxID=521013 RepID=A0A1G7IXR9_9RHOB|nr:TetR/AcrR family transcriptional regulator [Limimaricola pyoseonensis]SDF17532.1 DNA-binding transcriptional regulator, AcrR family [Limimaricola pyoseonensis]
MLSEDTHPRTAPRRRLTPEDRRAAILDAAQVLFFAKGWDAVTVADVLAEARISKGGFYHHFSAKEDLLDGVVSRLAEQAVAAAEASRRQCEGDALTRFNAFLAATNRWKAERATELRFIADMIRRPGNELLLQRIDAAVRRAVVPALEAMIRDGAAEGRFDPPDPKLVAEAIVSLTISRREVLRDAIAAADAGAPEAAAARLGAHIAAETALVDRLLGLPPGSVHYCDPAEFGQMMADMACGHAAY